MYYINIRCEQENLVITLQGKLFFFERFEVTINRPPEELSILIIEETFICVLVL